MAYFSSFYWTVPSKDDQLPVAIMELLFWQEKWLNSEFHNV
jgi:hypothetical protein